MCVCVFLKCQQHCTTEAGVSSNKTTCQNPNVSLHCVRNTVQHHCEASLWDRTVFETHSHQTRIILVRPPVLLAVCVRQRFWCVLTWGFCGVCVCVCPRYLEPHWIRTCQHGSQLSWGPKSDDFITCGSFGKVCVSVYVCVPAYVFLLSVCARYSWI